MRHIFWPVGLLVSVVFSPAFATETGYPTDSELRSLHPYCTALLRGGSKSDEYKYWAGIVGPGFGHAHHFCQGLNLINRYYRATSAYDRKYYLGASLPEFGYMIKHAEPTSSLMPEVYLGRGTALWKLGRNGEAVADFLKAQELNPKFPRTYATLIEFYMENKLKAKALDTATEGLKQNPDSKMLQRRYVELGGEKPFPEPYQAAASEVPPPAKSGDDAPPVTPQEASSTKEAGTDQAPAETETATAPAPPPPAIGAPDNPWCRFCP
ncbi:MAG: tetratricopeptide repeat protein [Thiobacillus sp.]